MVTDNYFISKQFSMLSKLMDIHGENSFRSKTYSIAAFNIEKLPFELSELDPGDIAAVKGIGESTGKKIIEILEHGHLPALEALVRKTPQGVLQMLSIKGLGPKKIAVIWKEMEIESPGELLYACTENRLSRYKGFGQKTQQGIEQAIHFFLQSQGNHLYAEIESYANQMTGVLRKAFPDDRFEVTGHLRRQSLTVDRIEWVTTVPVTELQRFFSEHNFQEEEILSGTSSFRTPEKILIQFYSRTPELFHYSLFETSSSEEFIEAWKQQYPHEASQFNTEGEIFSSKNIHVVPSFLREKKETIGRAVKERFDDLIAPDDIRGIVHSHSTWSDGSNTIEQMAKACIGRGLEYLVISDHSKSASYANGLTEDRIKAQHAEIDELNNRLAPFRIFKGIESDILGDGSLDYADRILETFEIIIASVHSNLKMTEEKAMSRLLRAIANPFTTILGHPTGRLLLSRPGYPVNYEEIIGACAEYNVVVEINANPRRLDLDWRWVDLAIGKNVLVSINPDAHEIEEYDNCRYGVLAAQKAAVKPAHNLSSMPLADFEKKIAR